MEWFGLEGTLKITQVQLFYQGQGHLQRDQISQNPIQSGHEHFQRWGSHSFSGQAVPGPPHPRCKKKKISFSDSLDWFSLSLKPFPGFQAKSLTISCWNTCVSRHRSAMHPSWGCGHQMKQEGLKEKLQGKFSWRTEHLRASDTPPTSPFLPLKQGRGSKNAAAISGATGLWNSCFKENLPLQKCLFLLI